MILWISNYLTNTSGPKINGETSDLLPVTSGIPQGSVLGLLLFLLYVNDVNDAALSKGSKLVLTAMASPLTSCHAPESTWWGSKVTSDGDTLTCRCGTFMPLNSEARAHNATPNQKQ